MFLCLVIYVCNVVFVGVTAMVFSDICVQKIIWSACLCNMLVSYIFVGYCVNRA